jgi:hypothetical protein
MLEEGLSRRLEVDQLVAALEDQTARRRPAAVDTAEVDWLVDARSSVRWSSGPRADPHS